MSNSIERCLGLIETPLVFIQRTSETPVMQYFAINGHELIKKAQQLTSIQNERSVDEPLTLNQILNKFEEEVEYARACADTADDKKKINEIGQLYREIKKIIG